MLLFYGNNFSDLRDFAWVYAHWDHHFWLGKTYLAALTSFVPRFASEFRDHWGLGAATALTVGFDPHVHPGVRPGAFGEGYLNFGVVGVVAVGLFVGMVMYRVDMGVKQAVMSRHPLHDEGLRDVIAFDNCLDCHIECRLFRSLRTGRNLLLQLVLRSSIAHAATPVLIDRRSLALRKLRSMWIGLVRDKL